MKLFQHLARSAILCLLGSGMLVLPDALTAQIPSFQHLTIDDGLSQNFVQSIVQDHRGFMWFSTLDGLNRYDGYSFKVYRNRPGDTTSLLSNTIGSLLEDEQNRLWVLGGGLQLYDRERDGFVRVISNQVQASGMKEDDQGCLWLYGPGEAMFRLFPPEHPQPPDAARRLAGGFRLAGPYFFHSADDPTQNGNLQSLEFADRYCWLTTPRRLYRLPRRADGSWPGPAEARFEQVDLPADSLYLSLLFTDSRGALWLQTHKGLMRWEAETDRWQTFPLAKDRFSKSWEGAASHRVEDEYGRFWLATFLGILLFDPQEATYRLIQEDIRQDDGLSLDNIRCVYKDRSGNIWAGTAGMGIDIYLAFAKPFVHYLGRKKAVRQTSVYQMQVDQMGRLWYANNIYDLERLDLQNGRVSRDNRLESISGVFNDFAQTTDSALWLYKGTNLVRWDSRTDRYRRRQLFLPESEDIPDRFRSQLHPEGTDIWVCSAEELRRYNAQLELQEAHTLPRLGSENVTDFLRTADGTFWIGFSEGLLRLDVRTDRWTFYEALPGHPQALQNRNVLCLLPDPARPEQYLWLGTGGGGLHRLDVRADTFLCISSKDGLANDFIYGILPDEAGNLWLSTNRGLARYHPSTGQILNYTVKDGLQSNEFNRWAFCRGRDGRLFFGGINGITAFHPRDIKPNPVPPPVVLTQMQISYQTVVPGGSGSPLRRSITQTRSIELAHDQNDLAFAFAALDFTQPDQNIYRYRMEGYDQAWVEAGNSRRASYTNLSPGAYTFRVQGANSDGIWNESGTELKIRIRPPFWRTGWAYGVYALLGGLILLGGMLVQRRRRRVREMRRLERLEAQKLMELDAFKSRFFASISHEFRTPLTLIQGFVERALKEAGSDRLKGRLDSIRTESDHLLSLVNQLLDIARLESGKLVLKQKVLPIGPFAERMVASFDSYADMRNIDLQLDNRLMDTAYISVDPDSLQKILQNLLANAIKFTPAGGAVTLSLEPMAETNEVRIQVRDSGPGISAEALPRIFERFYQEEKPLNRAEPGLGIGLALVRELVHAQSARIEASSPAGSGAVFTIYWPRVAPPQALEAGTRSPGGRPLSRPLFPSADKPPLVLLVEDNPKLRAYLAECLADDFRTEEAANGEEALKKAVEHIPDLVVSDVMMPGMDGYALAEKLKTDPRTDHVPLILLTARAEASDRLQGLHLGADDYLTKPFRREELLARIRNLIGLRHRLQEKYSQALKFDPQLLAEGSLDNQFLNKVRRTVEEHLDDEQFGVEQLARSVHLSSSQLYRKLKALTGQSTVQVIQSIRLEKAARLLKQQYAVSEVAHRVGLRSPAYFSQLFKKQFGCTPMEFGKKDVRDTPH